MKEDAREWYSNRGEEGFMEKMEKGLFRELNPGPLTPKARIIPLDQTADLS